VSTLIHIVTEQLRQYALTVPIQVFEQGHARHGALTVHPDVASVLAALSQDDEHSYPEREALTQAILAEHRTSHAPLWASILIVAYYPMLCRLRLRLGSDVLAYDELDQLVVTAFLGALDDVPPAQCADRVAMRLRQHTKRRVFETLRKEHEEQRPGTDAFELHELDADPIDPVSLDTIHDEAIFDLTLLLERAVKEGIPPGQLEVVAATVLRGEPLRSYVERISPDDDAERNRMYQRLKRQRTRTLNRVRALDRSDVGLRRRSSRRRKSSAKTDTKDGKPSTSRGRAGSCQPRDGPPSSPH